ncbi:tRNA-dihydrouridine synthase [Rickettsiella grylli]|uniref:Dihydroorotate dehydrogenase (Dihydroorotate oxidase)(Dhodehase) (Dhodase) (Dhod) n=1 Tax=Rickettsiella grylli TaxID=59196 RepID=A8PKY4_9COXI|nr:tRNA-dihydrouridine synthase [Rickettsiella grylli]EDP45842.1 dihydroorotate dehydrogenase (dihydroorotate oxidase)(dhodehase) (dhodase) (dhod) [Rickettsiella grylli]
MLSASPPLYDIHQTFEENFNNPSISVTPTLRIWPDKTQWVSFLGYSLASKIGVAACAVTTGKGIALLAQLGFDILTYKTIRCKAYPTHPLPNIVPIQVDKQFDYSDLDEVVSTKKIIEINNKIAISNSFGNGCLEPRVVMQDIAFSKSALVDGQVLIVSVYGEGHSLSAMSQDFMTAALMAKEAGADIIELNFSCPNLMKSDEPLYRNMDCVSQITTRVVKCVGDIPLLLKIGFIHEHEFPLKLLISAARAGVRGISAINSISMRVLNQNHRPAFGKRIYSGISGYPIRRLALQSVKKLTQINQKEKLNLTIVGMGGITVAEHFDEFFDRGADAVLSATGVMWNPYLAMQFHQQS